MARRAIRNRFPMTAKLRRKIVKSLEGTLDDPESQRTLVHAAKALIDADRQNMEAEKRADDADRRAAGQPDQIIKVLQATDEFDPDSA